MLQKKQGRQRWGSWEMVKAGLLRGICRPGGETCSLRSGWWDTLDLVYLYFTSWRVGRRRSCSAWPPEAGDCRERDPGLLWRKFLFSFKDSIHYGPSGPSQQCGFPGDQPLAISLFSVARVQPSQPNQGWKSSLFMTRPAHLSPS